MSRRPTGTRRAAPAGATALPPGWRGREAWRLVYAEGPCLCGCGQVVQAGEGTGRRLDARYVDETHAARARWQRYAARRR